MARINVNLTNSKMIGGKLFITALKMNALTGQLVDMIVKGSTVKHPRLGMMFEYAGNFSRA
jgi:hypothetical protein